MKQLWTISPLGKRIRMKVNAAKVISGLRQRIESASKHLPCTFTSNQVLQDDFATFLIKYSSFMWNASG